MKREIKFRGYDTADGVRSTVTFTLADLLATSEDLGLVDPDSIKQLIARDVRGEEIYEGDQVMRLAEMYDESAGYIVTEGKPMTAGFEHYVAICNGGIVKCEK